MIRACGGLFEHGNEPSDSTKGGEYLQQWRDYQVIKKEMFIFKDVSDPGLRLLRAYKP
jgi:hypothetical protein